MTFPEILLRVLGIVASGVGAIGGTQYIGPRWTQAGTLCDTVVLHGLGLWHSMWGVVQ